jgi:hypothetical protein
MSDRRAWSSVSTFSGHQSTGMGVAPSVIVSVTPFFRLASKLHSQKRSIRLPFNCNRQFAWVPDQRPPTQTNRWNSGPTLRCNSTSISPVAPYATYNLAVRIMKSLAPPQPTDQTPCVVSTDEIFHAPATCAAAIALLSTVAK